MGDPVIFREYKAYGEGPCNIGDLFVEEGARRLLSISGLDPEDGDTLFVIGTPWLWNLISRIPSRLVLQGCGRSGSTLFYMTFSQLTGSA